MTHGMNSNHQNVKSSLVATTATGVGSTWWRPAAPGTTDEDRHLVLRVNNKHVVHMGSLFDAIKQVHLQSALAATPTCVLD